jgi:hypothetical protein
MPVEYARLGGLRNGAFTSVLPGVLGYVMQSGMVRIRERLSANEFRTHLRQLPCNNHAMDLIGSYSWQIFAQRNCSSSSTARLAFNLLTILRMIERIPKYLQVPIPDAKWVNDTSLNRSAKP